MQEVFDSAAKAQKRITIIIKPGDNRISSTLTIDIKYISISGSGARLLYDGNDVALRIFGSGYPPYDQAINETFNLEICGKDNDFYYRLKDADNSANILSVVNIKIEITNAEKRSGKSSLRVTKTYGPALIVVL